MTSITLVAYDNTSPTALAKARRLRQSGGFGGFRVSRESTSCAGGDEGSQVWRAEVVVDIGEFGSSSEKAGAVDRQPPPETRADPQSGGDSRLPFLTFP